MTDPSGMLRDRYAVVAVQLGTQAFKSAVWQAVRSNGARSTKRILGSDEISYPA